MYFNNQWLEVGMTSQSSYLEIVQDTYLLSFPFGFHLYDFLNYVHVTYNTRIWYLYLTFCLKKENHSLHMDINLIKAYHKILGEQYESQVLQVSKHFKLADWNNLSLNGWNQRVSQRYSIRLGYSLKMVFYHSREIQFTKEN